LSPLENEALNLLLTGGALCSDASLEERENQWFIRGDPTEGALIVLAEKRGLRPTEMKIENPRFEEIPFSSERKRMTTLHHMADGKKMAFLKGAPEVVLGKCTHHLGAEGVQVLEEKEKSQILKVNEDMAGNALRVLGLAYREMKDREDITEESVEQRMIFLGLVGMIDPPREEAVEAIKVCRSVHIKPIMITGDHKLTAVAIAREIGIYREGDLVFTGEDLEKLSEEEYEKIVDRVTVYARVSPLDKLKIIRAWKNRGEVVAMTGDGVNDAPALKQADIGVAMGITGTDVAKEASDMVLNDDNFATIVKAIERGRWIYDNIKKYLTYLLRCNLTEVIVIGGVVLALGPHYLPLLPAAILYINLVTDGLPALALGIAPPDPDIMKRPPRNPKESVFSREVMLFILLALLIESPFFLFLFFHDLGHITQARTEIFFLFIIIELIIALNFRSMRYSIFKLGPHKWLVLAILSQLVLTAAIIWFPSIQNAFGIEKPAWPMLALIFGFGIVVFISMELIKLYIRRKA
jgi:Ca2+-transporting ATPase